MHTPHTDPEKKEYPHMRLDTGLLSQIIDVEVGEAARQLEREGMVVPDSLIHTWARDVRDMLTHMMLEEQGKHTMMPQDIDAALGSFLRDIIDVYKQTLPIPNEAVTQTAFARRVSGIMHHLHHNDLSA